MRVGIYETLGALCTAAIACYAWPLLDPSRTWAFIYTWDDNENYVENEVFRGFSWLHLRTMFTLTIVNVWEPLGWLLKAVVYAIAGLDARAFRIATLIFHIATAAVLTKTASMIIAIAHIGNRMARKTPTVSPQQRAPQIQLDAASYLPGCILSTLLLFVVHPINVEVIGWPSTLPYPLASLFSMLSLFFHCRQLQRSCLARLSSQSPRAARGASPETETFPSEWEKLVALITPSLRDRETQVSAAFFVAAVLSKSVCIMLPVSAVLIDMLIAFPVATTIAVQTHNLPSPIQFVRLASQYLLSKMLHFTAAVVFVLITLAANEDGANQHADALTLSSSERIIKALVTPAWTMRHYLWPTQLRPHYQLHEDELGLFTNPDCLFSIGASAAFVSWLALRESELRAASLLAVAHFVVMSLPTCGIIQHGMVAQGADRYAYFPTMALIPIGGYYLTRWLDLDLVVSARGLTADAATDVRVDTGSTHGTQEHSRKVVASPSNQPLKPWLSPYKDYARLAYLIMLVMMVHISNLQMRFWQDSKSFTKYSLQLDPSDWRVIELDYAFQTTWGGGCAVIPNECNNWLNLMFYFAPSKTLKARLFRYKNLFVLGRQDYACDGYKLLLEEFPDSAVVHSNVAICLFYEEQYAEGREQMRIAHKLPHQSKNEHSAIEDNYFAVEQWTVDVARANGESQPFNARLVW